MRTVLVVLKIIIALSVLGAMAATAAFVHKVRREQLPEVVTRELKQKLENSSAVDLRPGEKAFTRARELLATGNMAKGREKLLYIVNFHPETPSADEARRILGEMNLDRILSLDEMANKKRSEAKPGDSITRIANREDTTVDLIMNLNGLTQVDRIQLGDEFIVMPLNFSATIEPARQRLTLYQEGEFVKDYAITKMTLEGPGRTVTTELKTKLGYRDGRRYSPSFAGYRRGLKLLVLSDMNLELRSEDDQEAESFQVLYFANEDLEELAMLLRVGNEVVIRKGRQ